MVWPFCPTCHTILSVDTSGTVTCSRCLYTTALNTACMLPPSTITVSSNRPVPLWAKSDEEQRILQAAATDISSTRAMVEEPCIKCNAKEVGFYTVQLRSVDEGQTVFYECPICRHTWSVNN